MVLEVIFHGPRIFRHVLQAEALTVFVLDYPFKDAYIVNSLGKYTQCLFLEQRSDMFYSV